MITRIHGRLVEALAGALDEREKEAVLGDLAESGESGGRALREIFGLVARREAMLSRTWRPRAILVLLVFPFSLLLSVLSRMISGETAVYGWMYLNNWDSGFLRNAGFWHVLAGAGFLVSGRFLSLFCWSWVVGLALGLAARGNRLANGFVFCCLLLLGEAVIAPMYLAYFFRSMHLPVDSNGPVSALAFYRVIFPLMVQIGLVAAPTVLGMRQAGRVKAHRKAMRIGLSIAAIATLAAIVIQEPGFLYWIKANDAPWFWRSWEMQILPFAAYWPVFYLLGSAIVRRRALTIAVEAK